MKLTKSLILAIILLISASSSHYYEGAKEMPLGKGFLAAGSFGYVNKIDERQVDLRSPLEPQSQFFLPRLPSFEPYYGYYSINTSNSNDFRLYYRKLKDTEDKYKIIRDELNSFKQKAFGTADVVINDESIAALRSKTNKQLLPYLEQGYIYSLLLDAVRINN